MENCARFISPLEKVFLQKEPQITYFENKAYQGESLSFQFCFKAPARTDMYVRVKSTVVESIELHLPKMIPAFVTRYFDEMTDDYVIFSERASTYYPDKLEPLPNAFSVTEGGWVSVWITVKSGIPAGDYGLELSILDVATDKVISEGECSFSVLPIALEKCDIPISRWLYYDCIEDAHGTEAFGDDYFRLLKNYFLNAVQHGFNTVLLPFFSHAQKNKDWKEPRVTQIVEIKRNGNRYEFDFEKLRRFIALAKECGVRFFETSHIASQQGARHCPRIVGIENGQEVTLFDINTSAVSEEYEDFLRQFYEACIPVLEEMGVLQNCYFHVSDEPTLNCFDSYMGIARILRKILPEGKLIDALHQREFADTKVLSYPVVSTQCVEDFEDYEEGIWVYYCCEEAYKNLSNAFFNHPLLRTRVLGVQLYLNEAKGFLHWGMNYWYDINTLEYMNPDYVADGNGVFPAGDSFIVYPGETGPLPSIRQKAFADGIRDYKALKTLEKKCGRERVISLIKEYGFLGYTQYTHEEKEFVLFMEKVQELLKED